MHKTIFLIFSAILICLPEVWGQNVGDLHELMAQEDYISCSLMTVAPGHELYSAGGHMAIRMNCPTQDVDYVYEFDAVSGGTDSFTADFLNGTLQGAYQRLYTSDFLSKAEEADRAVREYNLSLTPDQEVRLWSMLDDAVDSRRLYPFTPAEYNCCSMLMWMLQSSVGKEFPSDSKGIVLPQDYGRFYIEDCFSGSPWIGLL
ncbi:MAG: DUF4105 domain-containing protein [Muribaculaceae bacterium]|nr:DUF4105 domain-containing protein [Muribaculaceae bacterium]